MAILIHVLGTDTGVGKTAVGAALARGLRERGADVGVCKPFSSGSDPERIPPDAALLSRAAGICADYREIAPVRFRMPASPWSASLEEGGTNLTGRAAGAVLRLGTLHEIMIVEGIGGVAVPLEEGTTYLDFIMKVPGPSLLVCRSVLGTINHTLLTLEALKSRRIPVIGVLLNRTGPGTDPSEPGNPMAIERFGGVRVLGVLPFLPEGPDRLALPDSVFYTVLEL